jgi:hypothetical protein
VASGELPVPDGVKAVQAVKMTPKSKNFLIMPVSLWFAVMGKVKNTKTLPKPKFLIFEGF